MTTPMRFQITIEGRRRELELRLPALGEALSLWMAPHLRTAERAAILVPAEIRRFTGVPIELARTLASSPQALAAYRAARDAALAQATEGGMVYAQCPHCRAWEADLSPLALAVGLRAPFRALAGASGALALPALAEPCERPLAGAPAARLSFVLPRADAPASARSHGPRGAFAESAVLERLARWQLAGERLFRESPDQTEDWEPASPGWRALLRFGAIVSEWPQTGALGTPAALAKLPLGDFLFVDNVYHLTHCASLPSDKPLVVACQRCNGSFQPLAASPAWPS